METAHKTAQAQAETAQTKTARHSRARKDFVPLCRFDFGTQQQHGTAQDGTAHGKAGLGLRPAGQPVAAWGNVMDRILLSLRDDGPATRAQLERRLGLNPKNAGQTVSRLIAVMDRPLVDRGRRRAHICGWVRDEHEGGRAYPRPIYAYGHGANAPKPAPQSSKAVKARYWLARKDRLAGVAA